MNYRFPTLNQLSEPEWELVEAAAADQDTSFEFTYNRYCGFIPKHLIPDPFFHSGEPVPEHGCLVTVLPGPSPKPKGIKSFALKAIGAGDPNENIVRSTLSMPITVDLLRNSQGANRRFRKNEGYLQSLLPLFSKVGAAFHVSTVKAALEHNPARVGVFGSLVTQYLELSPALQKFNLQEVLPAPQHIAFTRSLMLELGKAAGFKWVDPGELASAISRLTKATGYNLS